VLSFVIYLKFTQYCCLLLASLLSSKWYPAELANFHAIYCLLTHFVNRMSRVPLIFMWRNMQYYLIQEILVSCWIIGAAHAQNGCFYCRNPAILWRRRLLIFKPFSEAFCASIYDCDVVRHYHITIHIIFDFAFVICIQWLQRAWRTLWKAIAEFHFIRCF
jgi:hypothetical protein